MTLTLEGINLSCFVLFCICMIGFASALFKFESFWTVQYLDCRLYVTSHRWNATATILICPIWWWPFALFGCGNISHWICPLSTLSGPPFTNRNVPLTGTCLQLSKLVCFVLHSFIAPKWVIAPNMTKVWYVCH